MSLDKLRLGLREALASGDYLRRKESKETFSVVVLGATNARLGNATCVVTINDDD